LTEEEKKRSLAHIRMQQAEDSLDEARFLFEGHKSTRSVINRIYYAMFYAILALFIYEPFGSSKHTAVLSYFNLNFVKKGLMPIELGRAVNKAFDLRQRADYRELANITQEQVEPYFEQTRKFIDAVRALLKASKGV
jgi:uncharacterized protein (UPF0332 family)